MPQAVWPGSCTQSLCPCSRLGNSLEGTNKTLCAPGPRRREQWPQRDWPRLACEGPGVFGGGMGQQWPAAGSGTLSVAVHAWELLKEVTIIFITSTIVWSQVNNREGTQPHPSTENWIQDLMNMALPIRTSFPHSQSLPARNSQQDKPLILIPQKENQFNYTFISNRLNK